MNAQTKTAWAVPKKTPDIEGDLLTRWETATGRVREVAAQNGWSKSEIARRADMAAGTFSGWYDGTYAGRYDTTTRTIENFLSAHSLTTEAAARLPDAPGFIETRLAGELFQAFIYAQTLPTISICTVAAGMGKTRAAATYAATKPHVCHVTMNPDSVKPHNLKRNVGLQLGIETRDSAKLTNSIIAALRRDGFHSLLIVDEAQYLTEEGVNTLRHFRDMAQCGLVILGNEETSTPYASRDIQHASPQVSRRIGFRKTVLKPYPEDIEAFIDAWQLEGEDVRAVARVIASRAGALGALEETIKAGSMIARGQGTALTAEALRAAYSFRGQGAV